MYDSRIYVMEKESEGGRGRRYFIFMSIRSYSSEFFSCFTTRRMQTITYLKPQTVCQTSTCMHVCVIYFAKHVLRHTGLPFFFKLERFRELEVTLPIWKEKEKVEQVEVWK